MKLTDVFAKYIKQLGIKQVFGLQGGAVVHFFDSLEKFNVNVTYNHHEESSALAATAYAKATQNIGCAIFTTGPGSTNAITGLMAAWQDSVPCIFISGQARSTHVSYGKKVRQVGTQEVNICDIVKPLTKYTKFINKKENFLSELSKAADICTKGRPGPVWLDVALDIQWSDINLKSKNLIKKRKGKIRIKSKNKEYLKVYKYFKSAKKPILIIGSGVKSKINEKLFKKFIKKFNLPFATTWNSADIEPTSFKYHMGIIGMSGQRGANKAVFNSDLIVCLGTHLAIPHTTTLYDSYVPKAKKVIVNIDKNELNHANVKFDLKINDNVENFFRFFLNRKIRFKKDLKNFYNFKRLNWYEPKFEKKPNSNKFINSLTKLIKEKTCIIADGGGTALYSAFQSSHLNKGNKLICSSSISSMGTGLAETIGVYKSKQFKRCVCIIGDGSFLMNIQDLQTIVQDKINAIILLINNNGYLAIRHTQKEFLGGRYFGTHPKFNLTFPKFEKIIKSFGAKYIRLKNNSDSNKVIKKLLNNKGPIICEILTNENQPSLFKQGYKKNSNNTFEPQPLSEMYPFIEKPISNTNN